MHIVFLTNEYPKKGFPHGGVGTFIHTISKALVKQSHSISIVGINTYSNNYEEFDDKGVKVYRLKPKKIKGITWLLNTIKINQQINKIHAYNPIDIVESAELGLAFIKKKPVINYIVRLHGGHHFFAESERRRINWWKGFQEKLSFKKADGFIAVSNYVKLHTAKYLGYHGKPIRVINIPISFAKFSPSEYNIIKEQSIVFVGTVCEKKGIKQLIQSLGFIDAKYKNVHLNVYGRDWFFTNGKSYINYLKEELRKEDLDKVTFHGAVDHDDLPKIYEEAHVCAFPSHMETQGLVAPEAMAMEKVVVFTNLGPGPETITPFETGLLCNPLDPSDIAKNINWVFSNNQAVKTIGKKAREAVIKKFNPDKILSHNINFYQEFIS